MTRGDIWLAGVGGKTRPVLILTRPEVINVRSLVTVAEVTSSIRGLATEVGLDHRMIGLEHPSVINCDGLHTVRQSSLIGPIAMVDDTTMWAVCQAVGYALGC